MSASSGSALAKPSSAPGIETWPTIEQAAEQLQTSVRTLWRYKKEGAIQTKKRPRAGKKPENVCRPADIARLMPSDVQVMAGGPASKQITIRRPAPKTWEGALERIATMMTAQTASVAIGVKLWLSLDEAAEYSGLARTDLLLLCKQGKLTARKSGGWKIQRKSLEEFEG
jgi:hypothetical protein